MRNYLLVTCFMFLNCTFSYSKTTDFLKVKEADITRFLDTVPYSKNNIELNDCVENITLINVETNTSFLYWASNSIDVSNNYRINPDRDIKMKAGETIVLKPKSTVLKGSKYLAKIEACNKGCDFDIPKGISPNDDGLNDNFSLSEACEVLNVKIFNRYGLLIFEKDNYKDEWHGQDLNNSNLPSATYFYAVKLVDGNVKTGWVYLQR